jgi:hypothetical protein
MKAIANHATYQREGYVRTHARSLFTAVLAVIGLVLLGSYGFAADYIVEVGADTDAGKDASSLTCVFDETCSAKIESLGLRVRTFVFRDEPERAYVELYGSDLSCCYFDFAASKKIIDPRTSLSRLPLFKGVGARGGLFIQNERAGTLYLRFDYR